MLNQQLTLLGPASLYDTAPPRWYQTTGGMVAIALGVLGLAYLTYRMVR